jgi:serine/threonine protein kinase
MASSSSNVVGVHYRVGKKIGEGSFGVIFEGMNLLNSQQVAIKFVRRSEPALDLSRISRARLDKTDPICAAGTQEERRSPTPR